MSKPLVGILLEFKIKPGCFSFKIHLKTVACTQDYPFLIVAYTPWNKNPVSFQLSFLLSLEN